MSTSNNNGAGEQTPLLDNKQPRTAAQNVLAAAAPEPVTYPSWGRPAGLEPRAPDDPLVVLYRRAVGVNYNQDCGGSQPVNNNNAANGQTTLSSLEQGCQAEPGSVYQQTVSSARGNAIWYSGFNNFVNTAHVTQILVGAALTALGPVSKSHGTAIMRLGALNTVLAGMFALFKAQGLPARLNRAAVEYRRLQEWIEETDALLLGGVVGRDREEVGHLVETTFRKFNTVLENEEGGKPNSSSIRQQDVDDDRMRSLPPNAPANGQAGKQNGSQANGQANGQPGNSQ